MHGRKIALQEQFEKQLRITPVVLLSAPRKLADSEGIADQESMSQFLYQVMKLEGVAGGFNPNDGRGCKLCVETTHIVLLVIQRLLANLAVGRVAPTDRLCPSVKIHSDVNSHLRLLPVPVLQIAGPGWGERTPLAPGGACLMRSRYGRGERI